METGTVQAATASRATSEALPSVTEFLTDALNASGLSQVEVARRIGIKAPNMINMIKNGKARLPLHHVVPLARLLSIEPSLFLRVWYNEYDPDFLRTLETYLGAVLSDGERDLLAYVRTLTGGTVPPLDAGTKAALRAALARV